MVGNAMADILVTSAMVFHVNMRRSVCGGSPEVNFCLNIRSLQKSGENRVIVLTTVS